MLTMKRKGVAGFCRQWKLTFFSSWLDRGDEVPELFDTWMCRAARVWCFSRFNLDWLRSREATQHLPLQSAVPLWSTVVSASAV
jgi:hypothetical protein